MPAKIGERERFSLHNGVDMYEIIVVHEELRRCRVIRHTSASFVTETANALAATWDRKWANIVRNAPRNSPLKTMPVTMIPASEAKEFNPE